VAGVTVTSPTPCRAKPFNMCPDLMLNCHLV
jgi:hypothetical protein